MQEKAKINRLHLELFFQLTSHSKKNKLASVSYDYDGNFTANLRSRANFFRGPITGKSVKDTDIVELSGEGLTKLAELIKELGQSK